MIIHQDHHILLLHTTENALEVAPPFVGRAQSDLDLLANVARELFEGEQRPVHARRRHLEGVFASDGVLDIEHPADLTADRLAVVDQDAFGTIDINPEQGMAPLGDEFQAPALIAKRFYYRGQQGLQLF
ncbi:hypothetical protein D9M71_761910 [compost metagenome]